MGKHYSKMCLANTTSPRGGADLSPIHINHNEQKALALLDYLMKPEAFLPSSDDDKDDVDEPGSAVVRPDEVFPLLPRPLPCRRGESNSFVQEGMPEGLKGALSGPNFSMAAFLASPVPQEFGLIQFRIVGDYKDSCIWITFDHAASEEPNQEHTVVCCKRVRRRRIYERRRRYEVTGKDGGELAVLEQTHAGMPFGPTEMHWRIQHSGNGGDTDGVTIRRPEWGAVPREMSASTDRFDFENVQPVWNERMAALSLNFGEGGRVKIASTKNFIMSVPGSVVQPMSSSDANIALRFGRVGEPSTQEASHFNLDVAYPLSPLQGIGIAMASICTH